MRVLIMNDSFTFGGTEVQTKREKEILERNGHEVYILTFDDQLREQLNDGKNKTFNIPISQKSMSAVLGIFFTNYKLLGKIKKIIEEVNPDIIHVNNMYKLPLTQYKALKGYKAVCTIRDYRAVCYKGTSIYKDNTVCKGCKYNNCLKECMDYKPVSILKYLRFRAMEKQRKARIKKFICPSEKLTDYCNDHGYDTTCINNSFDLSKIDISLKMNPNFETKKYLYFGVVNEEKGIFKFMDAFSEFSKDKDVKLIIAGSTDSTNRERLTKYLNDKIEYIGGLNYSEILKLLLSDLYAVVVPSMWMENYPNTVLEGMATRNFVLGSNRGGIPRMIEGRGLIFDILDKDSVKIALDRSFTMEENEYLGYITRAFDYVQSNNSTENYYQRLVGMFKNVINNK